MSERATAVLTASPSDGYRAPPERALWLIVGLGVLLTLIAALAGRHLVLVLVLFVVPLVLVAYQRWLLAWQTMFAVILLVILFIPIRRYTVGQNLPISLEPYRVVIAIVLACWAAALAADPKVRWRPTGYGVPILVLWGAILASIATNVGRVTAAQEFVIKAVTFFGSYFLLVCFIASVIQPGRQLDRMLRVLVFGGGVLACFALYEWRTGFNAFNGFGHVFPFMVFQEADGYSAIRGSGARALASAQHPIALGAALVMLVPLAVYLFKRSGQIGWLVIGGLMAAGALSTGSRTAAVMLFVLLIVFMWLKRAEMVRMLPYLLVLFILMQGVMPGTLGTFKVILNPSYVAKEQSMSEGAGAGRIADLAPSLKEWAREPFVGQGFGTRITSQAGFIGGARILDDQWLGTLLEIGAVGAGALIWLFARAIRRLARVARSDPGPDSWLATGLAASIAAYAIGMVTFDAFAFIQVTFMAFIMLGFGSLLIRSASAHTAPATAPSGPATARSRARLASLTKPLVER